MKAVTRVGVSLLLTVLFLGLFLRSFDLGAAWRHLAGASPGLIALSVAVNLAAYLVRAWRWRYLLAPVRRDLGFYNLTSTTFIGFMVSFLVPFRVGEIVRPVLLARRERLHAGAAVATVALERLLDAFTVMTLFLVFILFAGGLSGLAAPGEVGGRAAGFMRQGALVSAAFVLLGLPLVFVLVAFPARVVSLLHRLNPGERGGRVGRVIASIEHAVEGFAVLRRPRDLAPPLLLSFVMWLVIDLSVLFGVRAFGAPLGFTDMFLLMVPLTVGIAVPTPGGVGPYEFLAQTALAGFWRVPPAQAGAVAVALHAATLVPTIAVGFMFMWRDGLRPAEVRRLAAAPAAARTEVRP